MPSPQKRRVGSAKATARRSGYRRAGVRMRPTPATGRRPRRSLNWTAITSVITALTAVGALVFTGLSLNATRAQVAIAEQGHFTDRYTKAVEHLDKAGADHLQGRLGAIYALERLARDSPRDQATIVEMLSAFVRSTRPARIPGNRTSPASCPAGREVSPDARAALTVLARRDPTQDNLRIDLRSTCFNEADLSHVDLRGMDLEDTDLSGANLYFNDLRGARLMGAKLNSANLGGADLREVNLVGAELRNADLSSARLQAANLRGTKLSRANLTEAHLQSANLNGAQLTEAIFPRARLAGATFVLTDLRQADLHLADLRGADLRESWHDATTVIGEATWDAMTQGKWW